MNKIAVSYIVNLLYSIVSCWALVEFYYFFAEFSNIIKYDKFSFEISMNVMPFVLLLTGALIAFVFYKRKKKKVKFLSVWVYPLLFPQEDEREEGMTAKACRATFLSLWCVLPFALALLVFTPLVSLYVPAYPLYIVYFIYFIQMTVFHISLYRNKFA
ncbi:DUF2178 domain-containing protein [Bacillus cytotoxicus]|uniref:DUF2178 domain-containing protein n=1 Tax=Bacillus cytotoxicus TaxID=580165 RepID=UPI000B34D056|nr:DUF2178 domain-containing protein [Bacillus cytotoxicus]AWC27565.1 DUF2178 domain-containing protein [Bacillus cytotoxicus]AWC41060.1 DUF2178 domain-containing protein [Bacillus cytotoxicus]AWC48991.1 DUF2178 domain-containing protein [Bacillus cytotoxicus]AWC51631.1 DUF2178 domain-containing protein [Bacillus cytotoxicus]AWC55760.1 DUF2178 domain-containing protein [Bacillus cytotoxicus]